MIWVFQITVAQKGHPVKLGGLAAAVLQARVGEWATASVRLVFVVPEPRARSYISTTQEIVEPSANARWLNIKSGRWSSVSENPSQSHFPLATARALVADMPQHTWVWGMPTVRHAVVSRAALCDEPSHK